MIEKRIIPLLVVCWMLGATPAWSGNVDVGININIGAPISPPVIVPEPPLFLTPSHLGFQVAVGVPEDLFIIGGRFYLHKDNYWRVGPGYNGPWQVIRHDHLPPGLRQHKLREIRSYREREYINYKKDKAHYRGRWYRPERQNHDHDRDRNGDRQRWTDHDLKREHDNDRDWYRQQHVEYGRDQGRDRNWDRQDDDQHRRDSAQNKYRESNDWAEQEQGHGKGHGKGHEKWK